MRRNHSKDEAADDGDASAETSADSRIRLNKFMAELGVASRRKCDEMIAAGKVSIDGEPCVELGTKIDPERQVVDVGGVVLKPQAGRKRYYLLNKPRHVLCTNESREMRTRAIDLITDRNKGRIFSVGRLDEDSSGLLLLTNDGDFANQIAHPRHSVPKTYLVKVRGRIDEETLARISEGVRLSEGRTGGAALHVERRSTEASVLTVTIREGKNREVRRVFAALGYKVLRLHRVRIGMLADRRLKDGEWRPLTPEEVADLLDIASNRERAEQLFARASQGSFSKRPSEESQERERRRDRGADRSRTGARRREWLEPKDFRIKDRSRARRGDGSGGRDQRGRAPEAAGRDSDREGGAERRNSGREHGAERGDSGRGQGATRRGFGRGQGAARRDFGRGPDAARGESGGRSNTVGRDSGRGPARRSHGGDGRPAQRRRTGGFQPARRGGGR